MEQRDKTIIAVGRRTRRALSTSFIAGTTSPLVSLIESPIKKVGTLWALLAVFFHAWHDGELG